MKSVLGTLSATLLVAFNLVACGGAQSNADVDSDGDGLTDKAEAALMTDPHNADSDNDPFTGTDPELLYVKVQINGAKFALETLITQ